MARRIEDLADGIRSRDPESIRALFRAHHGMVFRFIRSVCRSRDEAEELTARAFFRLVDTAPQFRGTSASLPAYLLGIARNVVRENRRDVARWIQLDDETVGSSDRGRSTISFRGSDSSGARHSARAPSFAMRPAPDELLQWDEELGRLRDAIEQLRPVEQQVFHLRFVEGWSLGDVAGAMALPEGTVKSHVHRLREKLRAAFDQVEERLPSEAERGKR
ncbi:MAG: sigma-70 family RNA polymerase sigma factor [Candidatus Eisenbacteria bacterium]|uniref:Sigma-70 family RNA polymerase sigma factor n=1 Tax=Eiseniibacteriota bacterium TaxID=2212470 RepID=A0A956SHA6_UNCEI|nr:sigma-70 family RNA polymerase sigma factor [Candidatus Eisenbacteria bacterium]MCB9465461.1 sigma-70 family RNA polymerase sigma factor [Candidatus Eisenbacteria bacterium]